MSLPRQEPTQPIRGTEPRTTVTGERAELRARLAAKRAGLLVSLLGIERCVLEEEVVLGGLSAAGILEQLAAQERMLTESLHRFVDENASTGSNGAHARRAQLSFDDALAACIDARRRFLDALAVIPDERLQSGSEEAVIATLPLTLATQCCWNDASVALGIAAWTHNQGLGRSEGPATLVLGALRAARKELLTTVAVVPIGARHAPAFEEGHRLSDILWMIIGLQRTFLRSLQLQGFGRQSIDHAAVRPEASGGDEENWTRAWEALHGTHSMLLAVLDDMQPVQFAVQLGDGSTSTESIYTWVRGSLLHDRFHAAALRSDLQLDWPERLLR